MCRFRGSRILIGVAGSKIWAARILPGGPCSSSYSLISGAGSVPTTSAIDRM